MHNINNVQRSRLAVPIVAILVVFTLCLLLFLPQQTKVKSAIDCFLVSALAGWACYFFARRLHFNRLIMKIGGVLVASLVTFSLLSYAKISSFPIINSSLTKAALTGEVMGSVDTIVEIYPTAIQASKREKQTSANWDIRITRDSLGIGQDIESDFLNLVQQLGDAVRNDQNRGDLVRSLAQVAFDRADRRYNVMVFNLAQKYDENFRDIQLFVTASYSNIISYGIWIFETGDFTNHGDGGYINWAFHGSFNRNGSYVRFRKP